VVDLCSFRAKVLDPEAPKPKAKAKAKPKPARKARVAAGAQSNPD
jgi:hypothetical protein